VPSKWIGCIRKGQAGNRWSPREKAYRYDPEDKLCNAGSPEYDMRFHDEFSPEPTKEDWPSAHQGVTVPLVSTGAR